MKIAPRVETDEAASGDRRLDGARLRVTMTPQRRPGLLAFWVKINNDWIFNLSGLLAYNFLISSFPILIPLLAGAGFAPRASSPETQIVLQRSLAQALPPPAGEALVDSVADHLRSSASGLRSSNPAVLLLPRLHPPSRRGDQLLGRRAARDRHRYPRHPASDAGAQLDTGAAGPTAGQPQEELQRHRRWRWPQRRARASAHQALGDRE